MIRVFARMIGGTTVAEFNTPRKDSPKIDDVLTIDNQSPGLADCDGDYVVFKLVLVE